MNDHNHHHHESEYVKVKIPNLLYSEFSETPFKKCLCCDKDIISNNSVYLINKKIVKKEAVIEYAICLDCHKSVTQEMSADSFKKITNFFSDRINIEERVNKLEVFKKNNSLDVWIDSCVICSLNKSNVNRYGLVALCEGENIICAQYPMMLCEICEEQMQDFISKKTRETFDKFVETYFDCPPNIQEPYPEKPSVLI